MNETEQESLDRDKILGESFFTNFSNALEYGRYLAELGRKQPLKELFGGKRGLRVWANKFFGDQEELRKDAARSGLSTTELDVFPIIGGGGPSACGVSVVESLRRFDLPVFMRDWLMTESEAEFYLQMGLAVADKAWYGPLEIAYLLGDSLEAKLILAETFGGRYQNEFSQLDRWLSGSINNVVGFEKVRFWRELLNKPMTRIQTVGIGRKTGLCLSELLRHLWSGRGIVSADLSLGAEGGLRQLLPRLIFVTGQVLMDDHVGLSDREKVLAIWENCRKSYRATGGRVKKFLGHKLVPSASVVVGEILEKTAVPN